MVNDELLATAESPDRSHGVLQGGCHHLNVLNLRHRHHHHSTGLGMFLVIYVHSIGKEEDFPVSFFVVLFFLTVNSVLINAIKQMIQLLLDNRKYAFDSYKHARKF